MNTFENICAILSAAAYREARDTRNQYDIPPGAIQIKEALDTSTGFEARAFTYQGKIIIAYAGTRISEKEGKLDALQDSSPDLLADGRIGLFGTVKGQVNQAAKFYAEIARDFPGPDIVFTGHSLGGGLAALMGVYFGKEAITFDPAPFRLAATRSRALEVAQFLQAERLNLASQYIQNNYVTSESPAGSQSALTEFFVKLSLIPGGGALATYLALQNYPNSVPGEDRIKSFAMQGEFLTAGFPSTGIGAEALAALRINNGAVEQIINGSVQNVSGLALHSIALLNLFTLAPQLSQLSINNPQLIPTLMDLKLYAQKSSSGTPDFMTRLLQKEYATEQGKGFVAKFAADLAKISSDGMSGQIAIQKALTVAAMEYYYFTDQSAAKPEGFFGFESGALHINMGDIPAGSSSLKSLILFRQAMQESNPDINITLNAQSQLHIQSGGGAMNWQDAQGEDGIAIGGAGDDVLRGGAGLDQLLGGAGDDTLDGGAGGDRLMGGEGSDTYQLTSGELFDIISDSDGNGVITVDGQQLTGGKKAGENYWISDDKAWGYLLTSSGDLVISKGSSLDNLTVRGWASSGGSKLGIVLDEQEADAPPAPQAIYLGDQRAPIAIDANGNEYYNWAATGGYDAQGNLSGALAEEGFADVLNLSGASSNVRIDGLGGGDVLGVGSGNDQIDGGEGDDLIAGGAGSDNILGGGGNDIIHSAGSAYVPQRLYEGEEITINSIALCAASTPARCSKRLKNRRAINKLRCSLRKHKPNQQLAVIDIARSAIEIVVIGGVQ